MGEISLTCMRKYLYKSISSWNENKLHGLLAEIDFRKYLSKIGFEDRISPGGWIVRNTGPGVFAHNTVVLFPITIEPDKNYSQRDINREPARGLYTICATMHQIGIKSYYCIPVIKESDDYKSIEWFLTQLGIPSESPYIEIEKVFSNFEKRERRYNFLRNKSDTSAIPSEFIPEEFTKEHLRISFRDLFMGEISDIDGILWGEQYTYPIEIKEKTPADDRRIGEYFGLDVHPFVKLAYYAAKKGNLHSIFVVREIDNTEDRNLIKWHFITFEKLAQFASWTPQGGGRNMMGGSSTVIRIPKAEFSELTEENLKKL